MGQHEAIGSSSYICQWADTKPLAAAAAYANGPMQIHQQQQLYMPMGLCKAISTSSYICQWAHADSSAAAAVYANGPT